MTKRKDQTISQKEREAFERIRRKYEQWKPTLDELKGSDEYEGPFGMGDYWETAKAIVRLRQAREAAGLGFHLVIDLTEAPAR